MRVFHSDTNTNRAHHPPHEVFAGERVDAQEVPARIDRILDAIRDHHEMMVVEDVSERAMDLIEQVHSTAYVEFVRACSNEVEDYVYPSVFPHGSSLNSFSDELDAQLPLHGRFCFDTYTPIGPDTWQAALHAAACAVTATDSVSEDGGVAYALCRPPGHHASSARMGGYSYLNNAAISAEALLARADIDSVATLDVDFHHGNGTQEIFYNRDDVLTISIHADPNWKFPHFTGFANESGEDEGEGHNHNFPLSESTSDARYQQTLQEALDIIREFSPDALVVSYGADTHHSDPIGGFALTTDYFTDMARSIAQLQLPTVIVQEGGYNTAQLGYNVGAFLHGFEHL